MNGTESIPLAWRFAVAIFGGLFVGIEREYSERHGKHSPHFAGTRTFLLLGLLGAIGAELIATGRHTAGSAILLASAALIVTGYAITSRKGDVGSTTEVAALIVLAAGAFAGSGQIRLACGLFALTVLVLYEKRWFHTAVERIRFNELTAAVRFAVLALVIFPLLPKGPFGPPPGLHPQELWALVLLFSGLSFASFVVLRFIGLHRGYALTGLLGGIISSTAVTLNFSRESRNQPQLGRVLGLGVVAACTVLPLRVILLTSALKPQLCVSVMPYMLVPFATGLIAVVLTLRRNDPQTIKAEIPKNPLRFLNALQMVAVFQVVLYAIGAAQEAFGASGLLLSSAAAGLTDVDAVIYSMVKLGEGSPVTQIAAQALGAGVLANTLFKLAAAWVVGRGVYRQVVSFGLVALSLASASVLLLLR